MPAAEHQATVVWLQDTTDDSQDFVTAMGLPNVKWICPQVYLNLCKIRFHRTFLDRNV